MEYLVKLTARAERDLSEFYLDTNAENSALAPRWYRGLKLAILSLRKQPNRCRLIRKKGAVHQLLYGHKPYIYRVIYRVLEKEKRVELLHNRHGSRRPLKGSDID
jgi:toxin ParE1/3/4